MRGLVLTLTAYFQELVPRLQVLGVVDETAPGTHTELSLSLGVYRNSCATPRAHLLPSVVTVPPQMESCKGPKSDSWL